MNSPNHNVDPPDLYRAVHNFNGCGLVLAILFIGAGGFFLIHEVNLRIQEDLTILRILLSPLTAFALSLLYIGSILVRGMLKKNLKPGRHNVYDPKKDLYIFYFNVLNVLNLIVSMLWIFTNRWSLDNGNIVLIGAALFVLLFFGLNNFVKKLSHFYNQNKFGESMLDVMNHDHMSSGKVEFQFSNHNLFEKAKNLNVTLTNLSELYAVNTLFTPIRDLDVNYRSEPVTIPLKGRDTFFELNLPEAESNILPTDYLKKDGISYWMLEVTADNSNYYARFFPEIQ